MPFSEDASAEHLAKLCLIKLTDKEKETLGENIKQILSYMDLLNEVDTNSLQPCTTVLETMVNVMREDTEGAHFDREQFFKNVPEHVGGMIKVPPVIQFEE